MKWYQEQHSTGVRPLMGNVYQKTGTEGLIPYLGIQLIDYEVTEGCFKEVILCTVLQQRVIHGVCSNLGTESRVKFKTFGCFFFLFC